MPWCDGFRTRAHGAPGRRPSLRLRSIDCENTLFRSKADRDLPRSSGGRYLFVFLLTFYLALDFADPSMPGALNFDVDLNHDVVLTKVPAKIDANDTSAVLPERTALIVDHVAANNPATRDSRYFMADWIGQLRLLHSHSHESSASDEAH